MKSMMMKWAGHVAGMREKRNAYRILEGKPEGRRLQGRRRSRGVDNIKMDWGKWDRVVWTEVTWLRIENSRGVL
jgi:hypothetical protein